MVHVILLKISHLIHANQIVQSMFFSIACYSCKDFHSMEVCLSCSCELPLLVSTGWWFLSVQSFILKLKKNALCKQQFNDASLHVTATCNFNISKQIVVDFVAVLLTKHFVKESETLTRYDYVSFVSKEILCVMIDETLRNVLRSNVRLWLHISPWWTSTPAKLCCWVEGLVFNWLLTVCVKTFMEVSCFWFLSKNFHMSGSKDIPCNWWFAFIWSGPWASRWTTQ